MAAAPAGAINLALGELGFELPQVLKDKAIELIRDNTPVYTPNAGIGELRAAVASSYQETLPEQVCVCNGAEEAAFVTLLALLNPGDRIAIPDPDYSAYPAIASILEADIVRLPYTKDFCGFDPDLWRNLLSDKVKALILSHPSNPAGFVFTESQARFLVDLCSMRGIHLVVDEIYRSLFFGQEPLSFSGMGEGVITLGGLSKSHCMSGWRLGWVIAPLAMMDSIVKARQYVSTCSNWLSQHLGVFALSEEGLRAGRSVREQLTSCRRVALDCLKPHLDKVHAPSATPYLMLKVSGDDLDAARSLASKGVLCAPGSAFGEDSRGWLRINIAVDQTALQQALKLVSHELYPH